MIRSMTIRSQLTAAFALPLLALVVLGFLSHRSREALVDTSDWVAHTHEVLGGLSNLLSTIKDAETGQRGYLLTGREDFLEPYRVAVAELGREMNHLNQLISDNSDQQRRLDTLRPVVQDKLAELGETIEIRGRDGLEPAVKAVQSERGKQAMDRIREIVGEMVDVEQKLLAERSDDAGVASRQLTWVLAGGVAGSIALVILMATTILRSLVRQLSGAIQHIQSSSSELQAAATQQVKGARGQASATAEVSTTVRELVSTSRQIAESAQRVTQIAADTAHAARAGDTTVSVAQEAIDAVKRQVDRSVAHMLDLGKKSQEIGAILEIINELAEQTNILAINATIESVGAGETGRRFGVVADEIRKLADRVGGATRDIRGLIEEIRGAANTTVMATEDGVKAVEAGTRRFGEVAASFRSIAGHVTTTAEASREIELSTKQQTTAVEQVNLAIGEVAQTARETEVSSNQTLQTAEQLTTLSLQLAGLVERRASA